MEQAKEKNTYKYQLKIGRKVILRSTTYDLNRREAEHQEEFPGSRVEQIGRKTTREAALKWERQNGKRPYKKRANDGDLRGNRRDKIEETILQKHKPDWLDYYFFHQIGAALGYEKYRWSSLDIISPLLMMIWQLRHMFRYLKLARKQDIGEYWACWNCGEQNHNDFFDCWKCHKPKEKRVL